MYGFEGFFVKQAAIACRGFRLLVHSTLCFPITFEKLGSHVLSMAYISFNCNYFLRSLVKLREEGKRMIQDSSTGPLVGFCLIMLTIWWENGVRSQEQTRLICFTGLSTQLNYCITNSNSFNPWRSTLISVCNTGAGVCCGSCMLTRSLHHNLRAVTEQKTGIHGWHTFRRHLRALLEYAETIIYDILYVVLKNRTIQEGSFRESDILNVTFHCCSTLPLKYG